MGSLSNMLKDKIFNNRLNWLTYEEKH